MKYISEKLANVEIVFVAINKAPQKRERWDVVDATNNIVKAATELNSKWHYVDVNDGLFDSEGKQIEGYWYKDDLHFNPICYTEVFTPKISAVVQPIWNRL